MQEYRAYIVGSKGQIRRRIDFRCENDEIATERAQVLVDGHDVELRQRDRMVCEFKAGHRGRRG